MKIGMMVAAELTTPPPEGVIYAPVFIAQMIAEGLAKKGHEIYYFAPEGSHVTGVILVSGNLQPLHREMGAAEPEILTDPQTKRQGGREKIIGLWDQYLVSLLYEQAEREQFDLIHIHPVDRALPFARISKIPTVYTLHDPIYPWRKDVYELFSSKNQYYVSLSDAQRKPAPNLQWAGTVYNGIDLDLFPFAGKPEDIFISLGRISPEKGVHIAIDAVNQLNERLLLVGNQDLEYWNMEIKPRLGKNVQYEGLVPYDKTYLYYQKAKALLAPIQWDEPFGLVYIEAMACGTPVITFNRGAALEVVKNGVTGFVVETFDEMIEAMKNVDQIDRRMCRKWVEENFTIENMIEGYEKIYNKIIAQ